MIDIGSSRCQDVESERVRIATDLIVCRALLLHCQVRTKYVQVLVSKRFIQRGNLEVPALPTMGPPSKKMSLDES